MERNNQQGGPSTGEKHFFALAVLAILIVLSASTASAETITVCGSGCDYYKIQPAVDAAAEGDTVRVADSRNYNRNIEIWGDRITLDCGEASISNSTAYACIIVWGYYNTIKNCEIKNCRSGIAVVGMGPSVGEQTTGNKIFSNSIHDNSGYGIVVQYAEVKIEGNDIQSNGSDGIHIDYTELSSIKYNSVNYNTGNGIYISNSTNFANSIYGNEIENNEENGIRLHQSFYDWIGDYGSANRNSIINNKKNGIHIIVSHRVKVINNDIKDNLDGVYVSGDSYEAEIIGNTLSDNEKGIHIASCSQKIKENNIENNGYGLYIESVCLAGDPQHEVSGNDFCYYTTPNQNKDIYILEASSAWGQDNTCQTTHNFNDIGASGCKFKCYQTQDCVPGSGPCCDGSGNYRPTSYKCQSSVQTEFGCPWGTGCGDNVGTRKQDRYCSGNSSACDGQLKWSGWSTNDYCTSKEVCIPGKSTCQYSSSCETCICGTWTNQGCGQGSCASNKMLQTRSCSPSGCNTESRCVTDSSCEECVIPIDNMAISEDTTFCFGSYNLPNGIKIVDREITLDCGGAELVGSNKEGRGINSSDKPYLTVKNCVVKNYDIGISLSYCFNCNIINNELINNDFGVSAGSNQKINNNKISENDIGIGLSYTNNTTINDNMFCPSNNIRDFSLIKSSNNQGTGNTCDKPWPWNDEGTNGCTYKCPCTDECTEDETRCQGNYKQTCGKYDADTCLEWPPSTSGPGNKQCDYGCSKDKCVIPKCTSGPCCDTVQGEFKPNGAQPSGYTDDADGLCSGSSSSETSCSNSATGTCFVLTKDYYCNGTDAEMHVSYAKKDTCGTCQYCDNNDLTCNNYSSSTSCGTDKKCDGQGNCVTEQTCGDTDTSCGLWPNCSNCNLKDGCDGVYYRDYSCWDTRCYSDDDYCGDCSCSCGGFNEEESNVKGNCSDGKDNDCDKRKDGHDYDCCTNYCTEGKTRCNKNFKQTCGNYDDDVCMEWPSSTSAPGSENCDIGSYCSSGSCEACASKRANCNQDREDGCEADLLTDNSNCGSCGNICKAGEKCQWGTCKSQGIVLLSPESSAQVSESTEFSWDSIGFEKFSLQVSTLISNDPNFRKYSKIGGWTEETSLAIGKYFKKLVAMEKKDDDGLLWVRVVGKQGKTQGSSAWRRFTLEPPAPPVLQCPTEEVGPEYEFSWEKGDHTKIYLQLGYDKYFEKKTYAQIRARESPTLIQKYFKKLIALEGKGWNKQLYARIYAKDKYGREGLSNVCKFTLKQPVAPALACPTSAIGKDYAFDWNSGSYDKRKYLQFSYLEDFKKKTSMKAKESPMPITKKFKTLKKYAEKSQDEMLYARVYATDRYGRKGYSKMCSFSIAE